jgi:hypothetical protein
MPALNPVVAIPIVDTSASMSYYNYVAITVIDTKAFLSNALAGDYVGVASYDVNGRVTYGLTQVDQALSVPAAASAAVQNLNFNGNCTNMGGGIQTAVNMLSTAPAGVNRGLILLSDGYQNCGTKPLPLPAGTPPIYSCAMGPNSDQDLMQQIATQSQGHYYYAPYVFDMMTIYNQIRAQKPGSQLLANAYKNASPYDFLLIPATISVGNDLGQFSVVWSDASIQYVNGQPGANQISVTLVTPAGQTITPAPTLQGGGYVVFNIPNPAVGLWHIQIEYGGTQPQGLTGGAFEYSPSQNAAPITLKVDAPTRTKAGQPVHFSVSLQDDSTSIMDQRIVAMVTKPKLSVKNALNAYSHLLKGITLPKDASDSINNPDIAKLDILHKAQLPSLDILPSVKSGSILVQREDATYFGVIYDTVEAGTYNIQLEVTGYSKKSGSPYSRCKLISILVED